MIYTNIAKDSVEFFTIRGTSHRFSAIFSHFQPFSASFSAIFRFSILKIAPENYPNRGV